MGLLPEKRIVLGLGLFGSLGAAVAASMCCLGPTLLIAVGGIVTATVGRMLEWFARWRPVFAGASFLFLGLGYAYVFRGKKADCDSGLCTPRNRVNISILVVMTAVVLGLVTSPYWLEWLA